MTRGWFCWDVIPTFSFFSCNAGRVCNGSGRTVGAPQSYGVIKAGWAMAVAKVDLLGLQQSKALRGLHGYQWGLVKSEVTSMHYI